MNHQKSHCIVWKYGNQEKIACKEIAYWYSDHLIYFADNLSHMCPLPSGKFLNMRARDPFNQSPWTFFDIALDVEVMPIRCFTKEKLPSWKYYGAKWANDLIISRKYQVDATAYYMNIYRIQLSRLVNISLTW